MQLEHNFTSTNPLLPSYENAGQYLSPDNSRTLFSASENNLNFFNNGTEDAEEISLDFLVTDFCTDSWTNTASKEDLSSTPHHLEVAMANSNHFDSPLISPLQSPPPITSSANQELSDTQTQTLSCPSVEKRITVPPAAATTANDRNGNGNETRQHLPMLLEITLRLYSKTPSITQSPISETLRIARQGLQAVRQCLPKFSVPPPAPAPFEPSSHDASSSRPGSEITESESSSILACILLMDKVLLCYEFLLKRRSGTGSSVDISSPSAPSPAPSSNSTSNPTTSSSSIHHRMQPIFIGDFEVRGQATWKVILDAVVRAEKQEARYTVSKLEEWANELVRRGKSEGHLAMTFLDPLKQIFHD